MQAHKSAQLQRRKFVYGGVYIDYKERDNLRSSTLCTDYGDNKMFKLLLWELFYSPHAAWRRWVANNSIRRRRAAARRNANGIRPSEEEEESVKKF